ncbi:hypothetical protein PG994_012991 [Apiospora phragmitis]|uniref:Uncharacterized protein n=1 Tax=Apiospora phragmitis TaxID=2905665 RepID=A0ABR1T7D0_9PEZI
MAQPQPVPYVVYPVTFGAGSDVVSAAIDQIHKGGSGGKPGKGGGGGAGGDDNGPDSNTCSCNQLYNYKAATIILITRKPTVIFEYPCVPGLFAQGGSEEIPEFISSSTCLCSAMRFSHFERNALKSSPTSRPVLHVPSKSSYAAIVRKGLYTKVFSSMTRPASPRSDGDEVKST